MVGQVFPVEGTFEVLADQGDDPRPTLLALYPALSGPTRTVLDKESADDLVDENSLVIVYLLVERVRLFSDDEVHGRRVLGCLPTMGDCHIGAGMGKRVLDCPR